MNELGMSYVALYRPVGAGGAGGAMAAWHPQIFASQLTRPQLLPPSPRIFRPSYGPAIYIVHYIVPYYSLTLPGSFQAFVLFGSGKPQFHAWAYRLDRKKNTTNHATYAYILKQ